MLAELPQTEVDYEFRVSPDPELTYIFDQEPQIILGKLFANDPDRVFLLEGSGFNMGGQLKTWINGYKNGLQNNESLEETRRLLIRKTIQDVIGFYYEYLTNQDIFPIYVEFLQDENNKKFVHATKYNERLEDVALPDEREGALTEGVKKAVEIMVNSGPETVVVLNSPKGWSGLIRDGRAVTYPDNQSYVYWIDDNGDLQALTIRTNIDLETSEKLVGINNIETNKTTRERLKDVVRNPIPLKVNGFEKVLDLIEDVSGERFDKTRKEIINRNSLFTLNNEAQEIIDNLQNFLTENITHLSLENIKMFAKEVGKAILDLAKRTLVNKNPKKHYSNNYYSEYFDNYQGNNLDQYYALAEQVRERLGCNGGEGESRSTQNSVLGTRQVSVESGDNICKRCGTTEGVACGWCKTCWNLYGKG
jgi:hypothetical protein